MQQRAVSKNSYKYNNSIASSEVRLIDQNGEMQGVMPLAKAIELARSLKLDLIEISPGASPPVCKIADYKKFIYEIKKKSQEAKKKTKNITLKEVKFRPNIGEHDLQTKVRSIVKFAEGKHKIKVSLLFRGREITHSEIGMKVFKRVIELTSSVAKVESEPKFEGKQIIMFLAPI